MHILLIRITKYFFPKSAPFEAEKNNISGLGGREPRAIKNPITAHKHIPLVEHNPINYIFFYFTIYQRRRGTLQSLQNLIKVRKK